MIRACIITLYVMILCSLSLANNRKAFNALELRGIEDISQPENVLSKLDVELGNIKETDPDCKCGPHSTGCNITDGFKTCTCKEGYIPGPYENCTEMCNDTNKCQNGGTCFRGFCLCPPRTEGAFCEQIYVFCWNSLYEKIAGYHGQACCCKKSSTPECKYDVKKADVYCECSNKGEVFDDKSKKCKECNCGKPGTWSKCDFYGGVKTCFCSKNYQYNRKTQTCEPCDCGENSKKCEFSWGGFIDCNCWSGYQQYNTSCKKCDCGSFGTCELRNGKPICHCNRGFQEWRGSCLECDCGDFGKCTYYKNVKRCQCDFGYADKDGKCEYCYCGDKANCTFENSGNKTCQCPYGYKDVLGFCRDINECEKATDLCPPTEKCVNIPGTYVCGCADGYYKTGSGCTDINECQNGEVCKGVNSECVNIPGSFECRCKSGYLTRGGKKTELICQSNAASKVGYGLLGGFFTAVVIILLTILYRIRRSQSN